MRYFVIFILLLSVSCNERKTKIANTKDQVKFSGKYIVCDTCTSIIIAHHAECTTCGEITVDSGTVFLTTDILKATDTLGDETGDFDTLVSNPNFINLSELYFSDTTFFDKIWKGPGDFNKIFRLKGKLVGIKRRIVNGITQSYPSLFFEVYESEEISDEYSKRENR